MSQQTERILYDSERRAFHDVSAAYHGNISREGRSLLTQEYIEASIALMHQQPIGIDTPPTSTKKDTAT